MLPLIMAEVTQEVTCDFPSFGLLCPCLVKWKNYVLGEIQHVFPAMSSGLNRNMARICQHALLSCASGVCLSIDLAVWSQQRRLDTCDCLVYEFRKSQRLVRNHYETRTVYSHLGHSRAKDAGKVKSNVWSTI